MWLSRRTKPDMSSYASRRRFLHEHSADTFSARGVAPLVARWVPHCKSARKSYKTLASANWQKHRRADSWKQYDWPRPFTQDFEAIRIISQGIFEDVRR